MTQTPSSDDKLTCDYQISDWGEPQRSCGLAAKKATLDDRTDDIFFYCQKHFDKAEPFIAQRFTPVSDV